MFMLTFEVCFDEDHAHEAWEDCLEDKADLILMGWTPEGTTPSFLRTESAAIRKVVVDRLGWSVWAAAESTERGRVVEIVARNVAEVRKVFDIFDTMARDYINIDSYWTAEALCLSLDDATHLDFVQIEDWLADQG